ncbi:hypothetical protein KSS87_009649, partial [Heliosperma pusillum]
MAGAAGGFVTRAFESMLKESSAKKFTTLHSAIQSYLDGIKEEKKKQPVAEATKSEPGSGEAVDQLKVDHEISHASVETKHAGKTVQANVSITVALSNAGHTLEEAEAELVLSPLQIAFETKNMKIVELALDCFHKLIAYDHLEGDPGLDGGKNGALFADILSRICSCVENSSPDRHVTTVLQVLKALLTAIASTKFRALPSGSPALLMVAFPAVHGEPLLGVIRVCYNIALNSKSPMNQATSKAMLTQMVSIIFQRMESDLNVSHASKEFQDHCSTGFDALAGDTSTSSPTSNIEVSSLEDTIPQNPVKDASFASIEELHKFASGGDIKGLETMLDKAVQLENVEKIKLGLDLESMSIGHRDALLLFRTLCKMGVKADNDIIATKTNILSLELLQGLLEGVSHAFTKNVHFINTIKAYLCYTLLRASISSSPQIFQQAAGIFVVLLLRFRESLKVLQLRLLKLKNLYRILEKLCKDPQMLVDIFVNYDCDVDGPNLFERMVTTLSKIAQGTQASDTNSVAASQSASIKDSSLQCLVNVFKTLVDWEKSHKESEDSEHKIKDGKSQDGCSDNAVEIEQREDTYSDFEEIMSRKSTVEAAIAQSMVGDFLGQDEEFPLSVMHVYVDSMNFSGMTFAAALREFLSGFRLPGEAQKIDRIMEKFAERYCADNPALFKNADTVYNLIYAVIMLNTDAHNPKVTAKMSKTDFVHLNSMADAEEIPPQELLEEIYDSIVKEKLKMNDEDTEGKGSLLSILNLDLPRKNSSTETIPERDAIVKKMQAIFQNRGTNRGEFYTLKRVELLTLMTEVVGWPLLATFSVIMEEGDNMSRVQLCMEGFKAGIHITNVLGMATMRYAFLTSLVRFTFLHAPKDMRSKNVEALRTLLDLGESNADAFDNTWNSVLECITRLDFITSNSAVAVTVMQASNQISKDALLQSLRQLAGKPTEQVFLNSVRLPSDAVIEFFTALCSVSAEELKQNPARVYSLQKLVEISYYNMARIRMVWSRIWSVLANHFVFAGSHHDEKVAMDAIDSLRQLGMKYLEHAELSSFTFQNDILKPFVVLMRNSQNESMRRLIVDCIVQMIKLKVGSIKSGWRCVFMIFTAAAVDESEPIIESAFENVEQVILEHFDKVVGDCFMDCVNCLIGFANNKSSHRISLKAIALLRICEDRLAEGLVPGGALKPIDLSPDEIFDVTEQYWFPMLAGLSDLTSDPRVEVRNCALEVLFDLLNERGTKFSPSFWESIFRRVLFPIFDHVRHAGN